MTWPSHTIYLADQDPSLAQAESQVRNDTVELLGGDPEEILPGGLHLHETVQQVQHDREGDESSEGRVRNIFKLPGLVFV